jgi:protein-L-isoaspartate(D-aspartate) O-methyltransferase
MNQLQLDYPAARNNMVDGQVRPNKVTDPRVLDAMRSLPRERFVPATLATLAYIDEDLPLGGGRVLMEPMVLARLVQLAEARAGQKALVIAAGSGYGAAVLAACGCTVTALEEDEALLALARPVLAEFAPGVKLVQGTISAGLPQGAPWDIIMIEGAVPVVPSAYAAQVGPAGRLVGVLATPGGGRAILGEQAGTPNAPRLKLREMFDCNTPTLPSLRSAPAFVF